MKTILTTIFALALMVFAFSTNPVMAGGSKCPKGYHYGKMTGGKYACLNSKVYGQKEDGQQITEVDVAGMTLDKKVQQDENDWDNYLLKGWFAFWTEEDYEFNEDVDISTEQREFASDRSGPTSSFSASSGINASLVGDSHDTIEREDTENDRVLESGNY